MTNNGLDYLQVWYESKCDGEWEHSYGVTIETLDNPGWLVVITGEHGKNKKTLFIDEGDDNWIHIDAGDGEFKGAGDIKKLEIILDYAQKWLESK